MLAQLGYWSRRMAATVAASAARRREALRRANDMQEAAAPGDRDGLSSAEEVEAMPAATAVGMAAAVRGEVAS
jgi:hypothetical protein